MVDDTILPFSFPAVCRKKITAAFDGGRLTSDGGVMLLALADRRLGLAEKLAAVFPDGRDPSRIVHGFADMIRARVFAIACGYEDCNDLDRLRNDPAFKLACGRLPDTDRDLCLRGAALAAHQHSVPGRRRWSYRDRGRLSSTDTRSIATAHQASGSWDAFPDRSSSR
jgi:hypothetical protein